MIPILGTVLLKLLYNGLFASGRSSPASLRAPSIYGGLAPQMRKILDRMPMLSKPENGPPFLMGPVLQLLIFTVQQQVQELWATQQYQFVDEHIEVHLDGHESSQDCVVLSWLKCKALPEDAPIVLIAPGLNCSKASLPGTAAYKALRSRGCRVAVFHKRGIGAPLKTPVFHLFGHPSDFQTVIEHIATRWPKAALHLVGYSSGNGLTGSHAALYSDNLPPSVASYALLVGGADYNFAFAPPRRNFWSDVLLDWGLLYFTKQRMLTPNADVLRAADPVGFQRAMTAKKMQELYQVCHKHFSGFPPEQEARINPFSKGCAVLENMRVPLLWVLTEDDPVMPGGPPDFWFEPLRRLEMTALAMFQHGSHLSCFRSWRLDRWVDQLLIEWLDALGMEMESRTT